MRLPFRPPPPADKLINVLHKQDERTLTSVVSDAYSSPRPRTMPTPSAAFDTELVSAGHSK